MMPALLAAKSMALARGPAAWAGRTLGTIGRDRAALVREDWMGRNEPLPVTEELDRMEKEQTLCGWFSDGRGSSVLWTTSGFRRCRFRNFRGFGRKKSDCIWKEERGPEPREAFAAFSTNVWPWVRGGGACAYADGVQMLAESQFCVFAGREELPEPAVGR